ncbi:MAG: hypothetical protein N2690_04025 [Rhodocyclaceae bacterium]|nr:hypothetical protein [Rhodocyclaceae bacterium]
MAVCKATAETVRRLKAAGATHREIAALTGLSIAAIDRRLNPKPAGRPKAQQKSTPRACLCCGKTFGSAGPMNRLCPRCRTQSASPFDTPAVLGRR